MGEDTSGLSDLERKEYISELRSAMQAFAAVTSPYATRISARSFAMRNTSKFFLDAIPDICRSIGLRSALVPATMLIGVLGGCVTDAELLAENSRIATKTAEQRAAEELNCPQAKATIIAKKEVPGQPLGELYSEYGIRVSGCGRQAAYEVECRDEKICSIKEKQ